jgi:hypothetical protein
MFFMIVSTPRHPTTVVTPASISSLRKVSGLDVL